MSYYLLPKINNNIIKYLNCSSSEEIPTPIISYSLSEYLYELKEKIDNQEKEWSNYKKYTNPYEYIHTIIPNKKNSISKIIPLSRSFFKMVEIIDTFNICSSVEPMNCFHLAEGPGGFIEATINRRNNIKDKYIGMTLMNDKNDANIPAWKKSTHFLKQNPNVELEYGKDNTGDILSIDNIKYCYDKYGSNFDLITADGGFDFSIDFNKQEINITRLLFAQICYALTLQKQGGSFILKMFDSFMGHSIDIVYILASCYEKVYITKPHTSRHANSEKYIVCKYFNLNNKNYINTIVNAFEQMLKTNDSMYIHRFLTIPISHFFLTKLEEFNAILGQQQIENIHYTLSLINNKHKSDKIDTLYKNNIQKCTNWCIKHKIPYNIISISNNIFINDVNITDYEQLD
jgi:23S rRNA U2552 (ribose-2'-O)-methylase RlmE/FtsJ